MKAWIRHRDDPPTWPFTLDHIQECNDVYSALDKMCEVNMIEGFNTRYRASFVLYLSVFCVSL